MAESDGGGVGDDGGTGGTCEAPTNKSKLRISRIVNGTRMPTHVPLDASQQLAAVAVEFGRNSGAGCSGTLIADRVAITAKHCTEGERASDTFILFGVDDSRPLLRVPVSVKV